MSDEPLKKCPKCKKSALKRLVGVGAGLIFKGSGFYITDYKNKGMASAAAKEAGASSGPKPAAGDSGSAPASKAAPESKAAPASKPAAAPKAPPPAAPAASTK